MTILDNTALRERLASLESLGQRVEVHDKLVSTSSRLVELAEEGAPHGTVVVARQQSAGRGRRGRSFASPLGGLWFSVLLRQKEDPSDAPTSLIAGLAASQALDEVGRVATFLKWPNDIFLDAGKVGGILVETSSGKAGPRTVLGIGLNVNLSLMAFPLLLRGQVNSLQMKTGREHDLDELLLAILSWLEGHFLLRREGKGSLLLGQISDRMPMVGRRVRARVGREKVVGTVMGLTPRGALMVNTSEGRRSIVAGEVEEVRGE